MHPKYNNIHKNEMFYALNFINNHIITSVHCMLSVISLTLFLLHVSQSSLFPISLFIFLFFFRSYFHLPLSLNSILSLMSTFHFSLNLCVYLSFDCSCLLSFSLPSLSTTYLYPSFLLFPRISLNFCLNTSFLFNL